MKRYEYSRLHGRMVESDQGDYVHITDILATENKQAQGADVSQPEETGMAKQSTTIVVRNAVQTETVWAGVRHHTPGETVYIDLPAVSAQQDEHEALLGAFDAAYLKAAQTSQPADWHEAALLGRQWRNSVVEARAVQQVQADSAAVTASQRMDGLRELCGYVENGSDTVVTIFQDDATREWVVKVGNKTFTRYYGESMIQALDAAISREQSGG